MTELSPYAPCTNPCAECPVRGMGDATLRAVGLMDRLFDPTVEGALPPGEDYQMVQAAEEITLAMVAPLSNASAVLAAVQRTALNNYQCPNRVRL